MSFLHRKRSRSVASMGGDDDFDIRKLDKKEQRRYSGFSQNTQVTASDFEKDYSCAIRTFPKHKSSHLRFLTWVAYTRKYTDQSITESERRTCPLLWCREVFPDQDAMLKHVWDCEHLSKGLYWCFHCEKPERMGEFQCKRCQGALSTSDRLTNVAKKIFSVLGSKRNAYATYNSLNDAKTDLYDIAEDEESCHQSPVEPRRGREPPQHQERNSPFVPELPNNLISEMEDTYVSEMSADWTYSSQELPDSQVSEMIGSACGGDMSRPAPSYQGEKSHDPWGLSVEELAPAPPYVASPRRPSQPILPRLNTDVVFEPLPQRQSLQLGSISDTQMSATIISPLSASDRLDFGAFDVSPTGSDSSAKTIFTDSGYSSATVDSSWDESSNSLGWDRVFEANKVISDNNKYLKRQDSDRIARSDSNMSASVRALPVTINPSPEGNLFAFSSIPAIMHSANRCTIPEKPKISSPHWSDARSLVESFSEVLEEHIQHSRKALKQMPSNSITKELLALSPSSIRSIGFEVLERLLEGRNPSAIVHIFAFTNIAYALSIAVDHDSSKVQTEQWFQHSLSWSTFLASERDQKRYEQIARAIWQPTESVTGDSRFLLLNSLIERENRLLRSCKHFLDILQSFAIQDNPPNDASEFDFVRAAFAHNVKTRIIDALIKKSSSSAFIEDVVNVEKRLNQGLIRDLRQVELELTCAGRLASQSDTVYTQFLDHMTTLCDSFYAEDMNIKPRKAHHVEAIHLTQQLIPADEYSDNEEDFEDGSFDCELGVSEQKPVSVLGGGNLNMEIDAFSRDADAILDHDFDFINFDLQALDSSLNRSFSFQESLIPTRLPTPQPLTPPPVASSTSISMFSPNTPIQRPTQHAPLSYQFQTPSASSSSQPQTRNKYSCHCGYTPLGEEKWKASNLARHKRTQHPEGNKGKVYRCTWPGCGSTFTRSDNLREHGRKKGHAGMGRVVMGLDNDSSGSVGSESRVGTSDGDMVGGERTLGGREGEVERRGRGPKRRRIRDELDTGLS